MRRAALLFWLAACSQPLPREPPPPKPEPTLASRLPRREDLVCFPCHSQVKFERGPPFAHASAGHLKAGHCHLCHQGMGHDGKQIDRAACVRCHAEGTSALALSLSPKPGAGRRQ